MQRSESDQETVVATNRKARHDYAIMETFEAGLILLGHEVKSLRNGKATLTDGYAAVKEGEVWLFGVHISPYSHDSSGIQEPTRPRKLLLHKKEIRKLHSRADERGLTLVPMKLYFRNGVAKILLGVGRGKRQYDKRQDIARREAARAIRRRLER